MDYIEIRVKDVRYEETNVFSKVLVWTGLKDSGEFIECFQEIENGLVIRHCDDDGNTVTLPDVYEANVISTEIIPTFVSNA